MVSCYSSSWSHNYARDSERFGQHDCLTGFEFHSLAMVRGISSFLACRDSLNLSMLREMIGICFLCFSSLDLSLLSSCSGNQFLFTHEPASESWTCFMSPFLFSTHYRIRGYPKSPLFFYPLNSRTDNLFITRVKRIHSFSFTLSCGNEKAGGFSPHSTLSKLLTFPALPQLSKPETAHKLRHTKLPLGT